mgnify:CR=1 FL=1
MTKLVGKALDVALTGLMPLLESAGAVQPGSAQRETVLAILNGVMGDHLVASPSLYGGTYNLFHYTFPKLGIEVSFVDDPDDLEQWRAAMEQLQIHVDVVGGTSMGAFVAAMVACDFDSVEEFSGNPIVQSE